MSSMQWRGASGLSVTAAVIRTSVPHNEHRYCNLTFRSSPAGGGSGIGVASALEDRQPDPQHDVRRGGGDQHLQHDLHRARLRQVRPAFISAGSAPISHK